MGTSPSPHVSWPIRMVWMAETQTSESQLVMQSLSLRSAAALVKAALSVQSTLAQSESLALYCLTIMQSLYESSKSWKSFSAPLGRTSLGQWSWWAWRIRYSRSHFIFSLQSFAGFFKNSMADSISVVPRSSQEMVKLNSLASHAHLWPWAWSWSWSSWSSPSAKTGLVDARTKAAAATRAIRAAFFIVLRGRVLRFLSSGGSGHVGFFRPWATGVARLMMHAVVPAAARNPRRQ
mmetsp:Transcript_2340/g.8469  ORF Transcript_2340/g.8469 Transcript_2340/m.8469 type:complete len:235 (+) Transcript_2340:2206-2910(+)